MKSSICVLLTSLCLLAGLSGTTKAEVVYTQVNVSIPNNQSYNVDLNHDGTTDFILTSHLMQLDCQLGTGYLWHASVQPGQSNGSIVVIDQNPAALKTGVRLDPGQVFYNGWGFMSEFSYGFCGNFVLGNWLNLPDRYLGLQFQIHGAGGPEVHYGWAKVTVAGYLDQHHNLQAMLFLSGFAYETVPGKAIMTGQKPDSEKSPEQ